MIFRNPILATKPPSDIVEDILNSSYVELYSNTIGGYYSAKVENVNGKYQILNINISSMKKGRDPWLAASGQRKWGIGGYHRTRYCSESVPGIKNRPPIKFYFGHRQEGLEGHLCALHCHLPARSDDYRRVDCFKIPVDYVDAMTISLADTSFPVLLGCDNKYLEFCCGVPLKVYKNCIHFAVTHKEPTLNDIVKEFLQKDTI